MSTAADEQVAAAAAPGTSVGADAAAGGIALPSLSAQLVAIDVLKGLAMVGVLMLHSLPTSFLFGSGAQLHLGQSVPIFAVLMGLNAYGSGLRRRSAHVADGYDRRYWASRIDRLYVPFLVIFAIALVAAVVRGDFVVGQLAGAVSGELPTSGPGNYYIGFAFQFAVVAPALYVLFRRWPAATAIACAAVSLVFEAAAPHVGLFASRPYFYASSLLRFVPFVIVGMALAQRMGEGRPVRRGWAVAALASAGYLLAVAIDHDIAHVSTDDWRPWGQTALAALYAGAVVVLGLRLIGGDGALTRVLVTVGRASYHVFLVQILWFHLVPNRTGALMPVDVVVCCALGVVFMRIMDRVPALAPRVAPAAA